MKSNKDHPGRKQMLNAIKAGKLPFREHLKRCAQCRELYELLSLFDGVSDVVLDLPPRDLLDRHIAVPLLVESRSPARAVKGAVIFDSWQQVPAVQLRDAAKGMERRMRLSAGGIVLELVAERQPEGWKFVARAYNNNEATSEFVLKVGRLRLVPGVLECYHWTAKSAPRKLQLLSPKLKVDFGALTWKQAVTGE